MKPTTLTTGRMLLALFVLGVSLALVSWDFKQSPGRYRQLVNDTVPKPKTDREKKIRDLDDVLDELNNVDIKVNMEKVQKEIAEAMKQIDGDKLRMEIDKAMKEVDMEKIRKEIDASIAKIDAEKIREEIAKAMKEVDVVKIQKEVEESIAKIDWKKIKDEMEKVKEINMDKLQDEMKEVQKQMEKIGPQIRKEMEKAKAQIEKAKEEMNEYKEFIDDLDKDGLINKKEGYTIKNNNGELIINGKTVSNEVNTKYRSFLKKHKKFKIEKNKDDFNIDTDDNKD